MNNLRYILIFIVLAVAGVSSTYAQKCSKKKLADKEIRGEYDYRGQSLFVEMQNGDTTTLNIVLYSKQNYRLFVVGEQKLGDIDYQIIVPRKKFNRIVKDVKPKKVTTYKKDPSGFYLYNTEGQRIAIGEETIMDTTWTRETTSIQEMVFDSRTSESDFWLAKPSKTQLISIKVFVADYEKVQKGCVGVYVGREFANTYQFRR